MTGTYDRCLDNLYGGSYSRLLNKTSIYEPEKIVKSPFKRFN